MSRPRTTRARTASSTARDLGGLNLSTVPKVLIECANMRNAQDAATVQSPAWRQNAARGHRRRPRGVPRGGPAHLTGARLRGADRQLGGGPDYAAAERSMAAIPLMKGSGSEVLDSTMARMSGT